MATVTALRLLQSAMSKINMLAAGETPSAEDVEIGLYRLSSLFGAFENDNLFSYARTLTVATLPPSTVSLTIGPAQQINMARPVALLRGSFGRVGDVDYPIDPASEEEYAEIYLKSTVASVCPTHLFFDGGTPTGTVSFWPTTGNAVELHLLSPLSPGVAVASTTEFDWPPGYARMVENNLAIELAPDFNTSPSQLLVAMAESSKRELKRTNNKAPQLRMDAMSGMSRGNHGWITTIP